MSNQVYLKIYLFYAETLWVKCSEEVARNAINEIASFFEKIAKKEFVPCFYSLNDEKGSNTCLSISAIAGATISNIEGEPSKSDLLNQRIVANQEGFKKMMQQYFEDENKGNEWKDDK